MHLLKVKQEPVETLCSASVSFILYIFFYNKLQKRMPNSLFSDTFTKCFLPIRILSSFVHKAPQLNSEKNDICAECIVNSLQHFKKWNMPSVSQTETITMQIYTFWSTWRCGFERISSGELQEIQVKLFPFFMPIVDMKRNENLPTDLPDRWDSLKTDR